MFAFSLLVLNPYEILHWCMLLIICLFGFLRCFQHCTGHITTGSWKGRGNQYIEFARVVYRKLPTNGKQLPAFPLEPVRGSNPGLRGGRRECYHSATVAPACFWMLYAYSYLTSTINPFFIKQNTSWQFITPNLFVNR